MSEIDQKLIRNSSSVQSSMKAKEAESNNNMQVRLYRRRFVILGIFCVYSMSSAFQWIEYAIITNIMLNYYEGATDLGIQWTSMIYMLSYIPGMFIATALLDRYGLRKVILIGTFLNALGSVIKIFSVAPNLFWLTFLGQTIAACAQSFILEVPPKLASVWFGPSEVSTATSIGVFGNQMGVALGFLLPPLIVPDSDNMDFVGQQIRIMFIGSAVVCVAVFILSIAIFKDSPPHPPSFARKRSVAASLSQEEHKSPLTMYKESIGVLMKDVPFLLLFITYGINTGTYYAIGTLLNPIILHYHPTAVTEVGQIGLTMVVAGLVGSVLCGYILDKTKAFKLPRLEELPVTSSEMKAQTEKTTVNYRRTKDVNNDSYCRPT